MFAACPHCHFLIALHPQKRVVPTVCPRCGKQVDDGSPATAETAVIETGEEMPIGSSTLEAMADVNADPAEADAAMHKLEAEAPDTSVARDNVPGEEKTLAGSPSAGAETDDDADHVASPTATETNAVAAPRENPAASPANAKTTIPNFTRVTRTAGVHSRVPRWQWVALITLSLLLAIQTMLADRARLAADASWRPLVAHLCGVFHCSIPVWRQPGAFTMLSRDVRPVTGSPGTLQAQATFRNDARWGQAWPIVLLTLKDADGRTLGARALMPSEYLDAGQVQSEIAPGQSAQIAVRIREPSANVVAFSFDFR